MAVEAKNLVPTLSSALRVPDKVICTYPVSFRPAVFLMAVATMTDLLPTFFSALMSQTICCICPIPVHPAVFLMAVAAKMGLLPTLFSALKCCCCGGESAAAQKHSGDDDAGESDARKRTHCGTQSSKPACGANDESDRDAKHHHRGSTDEGAADGDSDSGGHGVQHTSSEVKGSISKGSRPNSSAGRRSGRGCRSQRDDSANPSSPHQEDPKDLHVQPSSAASGRHTFSPLPTELPVPDPAAAPIPPANGNSKPTVRPPVAPKSMSSAVAAARLHGMDATDRRLLPHSGSTPGRARSCPQQQPGDVQLTSHTQHRNGPNWTPPSTHHRKDVVQAPRGAAPHLRSKWAPGPPDHRARGCSVSGLPEQSLNSRGQGGSQAEVGQSTAPGLTAFPQLEDMSADGTGAWGHADAGAHVDAHAHASAEADVAATAYGDEQTGGVLSLCDSLIGDGETCGKRRQRCALADGSISMPPPPDLSSIAPARQPHALIQVPLQALWALPVAHIPTLLPSHLQQPPGQLQPAISQLELQSPLPPSLSLSQATLQATPFPALPLAPSGSPCQVRHALPQPQPTLPQPPPLQQPSAYVSIPHTHTMAAHIARPDLRSHRWRSYDNSAYAAEAMLPMESDVYNEETVDVGTGR